MLRFRGYCRNDQPAPGPPPARSTILASINTINYSSDWWYIGKVGRSESFRW